MIYSRIIIVMLLIIALISGCVSQPQPAQTISDSVATPEYTQNSTQAIESTNDLWNDAYTVSANDLPDY